MAGARYFREPERVPVSRHEQASYFAAVEALLITIRAGPDAHLVEAMSSAAYSEWRQLIGFPRPWSQADKNDADSIRVGIYRALMAARAYARSKTKVDA